MTKKAVFCNCLQNNPTKLYIKARTPCTDTQRLLHIPKLFPSRWFARFYINFCQAVGQGWEQWDCKLECHSGQGLNQQRHQRLHSLQDTA